MYKRWYKLLTEANEDPELRSYWNVKEELSVSENGILLRGNRIVIPKTLRSQVVKLAHIGHQGVVKTKGLLRSKVWFPTIDRMSLKLASVMCAKRAIHHHQKENHYRCPSVLMRNGLKSPWISVVLFPQGNTYSA